VTLRDGFHGASAADERGNEGRTITIAPHLPALFRFCWCQMPPCCQDDDVLYSSAGVLVLQCRLSNLVPSRSFRSPLSQVHIIFVAYWLHPSIPGYDVQ
jgi:hypothetical protein